uniref:MIF4G domain-containing protein n=1 Tax=Strongyloides papillosus TaxID=174720 RepID=A0A0N5BHF2_STREA
MEFYPVVGRRVNSICLYELKNGNSTLWNGKLRKISTSDIDDVYRNCLPSNENLDLEHVSAFNSLMALGSFIKSQRSQLCVELTEKFSSSKIALGEGNNNDYGSINDSVQPLISISEELFESCNWILRPQDNCTTFIGNTINAYCIELVCLMGRNKKFKEVVKVLYTLAQRFVEYVGTTNVGVEIFKLLLDQTFDTDKTGTAELFLSVMLTARFDSRYSRLQVKIGGKLGPILNSQ